MKAGLSRRTVLSGAAVVALSGIGWSARGLFAKHYLPSAYDDVLVHLVDREAAARLGKDVLKAMPNLEASAAINTVRSRLAARPWYETMFGQPSSSLRDAVANDVANGRLVEAGGWLLPETVALLSALAART